MALHPRALSIVNATLPTLRHCLDCPTPAVGRSLRCKACRTARIRMQNKAFANSPYGRAQKRQLQHAYLKANRHKQNGLNRAYYERLRAEGLSRRKADGTVCYLRRPIAHVRAYRAALRAAGKLVRRDGIPQAAQRSMPTAVYPYVSNAGAGNALVLAVNSLVPQGIAGREDVCQNIVLAILEGKATLAYLQNNRAAVSVFCRAHNRESFELGGYAVSLSEPRRDGRSWYDVLPDTVTPWGA